MTGGDGGDGDTEAPTTTWRLTELVFDPIWPKPTEDDAAPEEFRLGMGRTLRNCTDAASLSAVFFTAWLAGDRHRFEAVTDPALAVSITALGVSATGAAAAYEARTQLLSYGNLVAVNSPMVDAETFPIACPLPRRRVRRLLIMI